MTDQTQQQGAGEPQGSFEPAIDPDVAALQANMDEFFGFQMDVEEPGQQPQAQGESQQPKTGEAPAEPVLEAKPAAPATLNPPAKPAPNGEPAPSENAATTETEEEVDPALLAQLMFGQSPASAAPQQQQQPAQAGPAAAASPSQDEQPYAPIDASKIKLPDSITQAIFQSEDPAQQASALTSLMASWGNAILTLADQRVASHHTPRIQQGFQQAVISQQEASKMQNEFYGKYEDLRPYPQIVSRVASTLQAQDPNMSWNAETQKKIGDLSRALARKMGFPLQGGAPAKPAAAQPFVAGGSRPQTPLSQSQEMTPATMVEELAW